MNIYITVGLGGTGIIPATNNLRKKLVELKGADKVLLKNYGKGTNWQPDRTGYPYRMFRETLNLVLDNKPEITDVVITGSGVVKNLQAMLDNMLEHNVTIYYFKQKDITVQLEKAQNVIENVTFYQNASEDIKASLKENWNQFTQDLHNQMLDYYSNVDEWVQFGGWDNDLNPIPGDAQFCVARG